LARHSSSSLHKEVKRPRRSCCGFSGLLRIKSVNEASSPISRTPCGIPGVPFLVMLEKDGEARKSRLVRARSHVLTGR
jgi:hypothetical protein